MMWHVEVRGAWTFRLLLGEPMVFEGLVDVEVEHSDGRRWVGTVGSLDSIATVMNRWVDSGECLAGSYFWCSGLLILREASIECAIDSLEDLCHSGELVTCLELVE